MADQPSHEHITGLILAGGQGRRLGGADKGWVVLDGQPLIAHVHARFAPQVGRLAISANRHLARYAAWSDVVLPDAPAFGGSLGPLAGIATALGAAHTPWLATVACDMPWLPRDLVSRLARAAADADAPLAVAQAGDRLQPVCLLLATRLQPDLAAYLADGGRRVEAWLRQAGAVVVPFPDAAAFGNLNTPDDVAAAQRSQSSNA